jgi:hypothetical protein
MGDSKRALGFDALKVESLVTVTAISRSLSPQ